jgi:prepilin-type N-terminal cleavage/methylation domain-containing protein
MYKQRGFSIAEVLTVTVILGILTSALTVVVPEMLHAPLQMQSQVDQVNTAALALYKIRRDLSEADTSGVMGCTITPVVSCNALGNGLTPEQAVAVVTAENPPGTFNVNTADNASGNNIGYPAWQGFYIYWLVPDQSGQAYDLMRAYEVSPSTITATNGVPNNINAAMVNPLVTAAMAISPPPTLTNYIEQIEVGDNPGSSIINFELIAGTFSGGNITQTDFQGDTYARN